MTDAELAAALKRMDRAKLDREERHFVDFVTRKVDAGAALSTCNRRKAAEMVSP